MHLVITKGSKEFSALAAETIKNCILRHQAKNQRPFVLGLCTGSSPIPTYQALVEMYKKGEISFKNVITFNMDEYVGIPVDHPQSYHSFMNENLFKHIDIPQANINIPDGNAQNLNQECEEYEKKIDAAGGIDLFLGGLGTNGHIAFNEPGSSFSSLTRYIQLSEETITANSRFFNNDKKLVPTQALTIGIGTLMKAKHVIIQADGKWKALAIHHAIEGSISPMWPVTSLNLHPDASIMCDEEAAEELKMKTVKYNMGCLSYNINRLKNEI